MPPALSRPVSALFTGLLVLSLFSIVQGISPDRVIFVNEVTNDRQEDPEVAIFADDGFVVGMFEIAVVIFNYTSIVTITDDHVRPVWESLNQVQARDLFAQLYSSNGDKVGSNFQVNTFNINDQDDFAVAVLQNGNFVVVWESRNQVDGEDVFLQLFNRNGQKIGTEIQVNQDVTTNNQDGKLCSMIRVFLSVCWHIRTISQIAFTHPLHYRSYCSAFEFRRIRRCLVIIYE